MAETMEMTETRQYKLREVRIRLEEGRSLLSAVPMSDLEAAMEVMRRELSGYDREVLCVVNLNSRLQPINFHVVSVGDLSQSIASIPNILKTGILSNAQSFMLLHNHPSGDVTPSQVDIQMTKRVLEAGKILGIGCVDHIIVGGGNETYFSMREQGTLDFSDQTISYNKCIASKNDGYALILSIRFIDDLRHPDKSFPSHLHGYNLIGY